MQPHVFTARSISGGRAGTVQTLREMAKLVREGTSHPSVVQAAHKVVRRVPPRDDVATMDAMLREVRRRMRYTRDPLGTELVKAPWVGIDMSNLSGEPEPMDCDDATTMLASLLGAVGIPSKFVVVATDSNRPRDFSHVYLKAKDTKTGRWYALDPIVPEFDVGQEVPNERLTMPRGYFDTRAVPGVGCEDCGNCGAKECDMRNRLNGVGNEDFKSLVDAAKSVGTRYIDRRYGAVQEAVPQPQYPPPGGFNVGEWLNPFHQGQFNLKGAVVVGALGFAAWHLFLRKKR